MHLLTNIVKAFYKTYRGTMGKRRRNEDDDDEDGHTERGPRGSQPADSQASYRNSQLAEDFVPDTQGSQNGEPDQEAAEDGDDQINDDGDYVIPPEVWVRIGVDQERSKYRVPPRIGRIISISNRSSFTSADWYTWLLHESPIYFYGYLPPEHFAGYLLFVRFAQMSIKKQFTPAEMNLLDETCRGFLQYYELSLYKLDYNQLHRCLPVFHSASHVPEQVRRMGPLYTATEWPMERIIRFLRQLIHSMSKPNENLEDRLALSQMLNLLPFVLPLPDIPDIHRAFDRVLQRGRFDDYEGNFDVVKFFSFALEDEMEDYYAEDGEMPVFNVLEPWFPSKYDFATHERQGRRANGPSMQDDSSDEEDGQDTTFSGNERHVMFKTELCIEFTDREKNAVCKALYEWGLISDGTFSELKTAQARRDYVEALGPKKWKTMIVTTHETAITDPSVYHSEYVNCSQGMDARQLYETHNVLYHHRNGHNQNQARYGEVQYFLTINNPRLVNIENPSADLILDSQKLCLASIKRIQHRLHESRRFIEVTDRGGRPVEIIKAASIRCLIGLLLCEEKEYILWPDGCLVTDDRK